MKTFRIFIISLLLLNFTEISAQVAVNSTGASPDNSAMLDIKSTTSGLLIPRMYTAERDNISDPATGLIVYVRDLKQFSYYNGSEWINIDADGDDDWVINTDTLYNNSSTNIAIGTDSPEKSALFQVLTGTEYTKGLIVNGEYNASMGGYPNMGAGTRMMFFPGNGAFRAGTVDSDQWDNANTGGRSVAFGNNNIASGANSSAFGSSNTVGGISSFAAGNNCYASGFYSFAAGNADTASATNAVAFGENTNADGSYSSSFGYHTRAESSNSFAIGRYNIGGGNASSWTEEDPLFEVGNGSYSTPSNAFTILKNGNTGIGTHDPDYTLEVSGDAAISGEIVDNTDSPGTNGQILKSTGTGFEWADASTINNGKWVVNNDTIYNISSHSVAIGTSSPEPSAKLHVHTNNVMNEPSGLLITGSDTNQAIFPSLGAGSRLMFYPCRSAFRAGHVDSARWDGFAVGHYSGAIGKDVTASGYYSTAFGRGGVASGSGAFTAGNLSVASGISSVALNDQTIASARASFAANKLTESSGENSAVFGYQTNAESYCSFVIGHNNIGGGTSDSWVETDPIFEIGNGESTPGGANAVTVLKNGNTGIGTHQPDYLLEVNGTVGVGDKIIHSGDENTYFEFEPDLFRMYAGGQWMISAEENNLQDIIQIGDPGADIDISLSRSFKLIASNGYVGIGMDDPPEYKLEVAGYVGIDSKLIHRDDNNTYLEYDNDFFRIVAGDQYFISGTEGPQDTLQLGNPGNDIDIALNDQVTLIGSSGRVGIGTDSPNEVLEIANSSTRGRAVVTDGGGSARYALLLESPNSADTYARVESYHYSIGGTGLEINTTGDGVTIFGGNVLPEGHKGEDLGEDGRAWGNVYCENVVNQGAAAFTDRETSKEILLYPPQAKTPEMFDALTGKNLEEIDPESLPPALTKGNAILSDEISTYNYKTNYEQQKQIQELQQKIVELEKIIEELTRKNY